MGSDHDFRHAVIGDERFQPHHFVKRRFDELFPVIAPAQLCIFGNNFLQQFTRPVTQLLIGRVDPRASGSAGHSPECPPATQVMHVQAAAVATYGGVMGRNRPSLEDRQIILGLAEMRLVTGAGKFLHVRVTTADPYPKHALAHGLLFGILGQRGGCRQYRFSPFFI